MGKQPYPYYGTKKSVESTQAQIQKELWEAGAQAVRWGETKDDQLGYRLTELEFAFPTERDGKKVFIAFKLHPPMLFKTNGQPHPEATMRMLRWWLKSRLEAVKYGFRTLEEEFLPEIVALLPGGKETTVGEIFIPQLISGKFIDPAGLAKQLPPPEDG